VDDFIERRRKDGQKFYCPAGHENIYNDTEADKLRKRALQAEADLALARKELTLEQQAHAATKKAAAAAEKAAEAERAAVVVQEKVVETQEKGKGRKKKSPNVERVLELVRKNPWITNRQLQDLLNTSQQVVAASVAALQRAGQIQKGENGGWVLTGAVPEPDDATETLFHRVTQHLMGLNGMSVHYKDIASVLDASPGSVCTTLSILVKKSVVERTGPGWYGIGAAT
jgi:Mn-dependent DtxR family transcriptional regulator